MKLRKQYCTITMNCAVINILQLNKTVENYYRQNLYDPITPQLFLRISLNIFVAEEICKNKMKATILYQSKKGKTAAWAREMAMYLWSKGVDVNFGALSDFKFEQIKDSDLLMLGSWTCGWFVVNQHPSKIWIEGAKKLPNQLPENLVLFATYKIHTGSIFNRMKRHLCLSNVIYTDVMKSKTGVLSERDRQKLDAYVNRIKTVQSKN
ncbi:NADPH-dependent FMN reductase family protein [Porphyromonas canoris]|nr:hypothetical protein [Porphyromonas canoris]